MNKKVSINSSEASDKNHETKKMNTSKISGKKKSKDLPWWVEFLFVQVGLPDTLLIKILKAKKQTKELFKNEKKSLISILLLLATLGYFYPVIKHA